MPGFDPRGSRFYFQLYSQEAKRFAADTDADIKIRRLTSQEGWDSLEILYRKGDTEAHTDYEFLEWGEVIKDYWENSAVRLFLNIGRMYARIACDGSASRIFQKSVDSFLSCIFPGVYWTACPLVLLIVSMAAFWLATHAFPLWGAVVLGIASFGFGLLVCERAARKLGIPWLMRTCLFLFRLGEKPLPAKLERQLDRMSARIEEAIRSNKPDEIILVGHSVGAIIATLALSRISKTLEIPQNFKFVTLGQCLPYITLLVHGGFLIEALQSLEHRSDLLWLDGTIRIDPLCFFMVNPFTACFDPASQKMHPMAGSGRQKRNLNCSTDPNEIGKCRLFQFKVPLHRMLNPKNYLKIRFNFLQIHFQYLRHHDFLEFFSYHQMTAGGGIVNEHNFVIAPAAKKNPKQPAKESSRE